MEFKKEKDEKEEGRFLINSSPDFLMKKAIVVLMSILTLTACNNKKPEKVDKVEYEEDYVIQESYNNDRNINKKGQKLDKASEGEDEPEEVPENNEEDKEEEENKK